MTATVGTATPRPAAEAPPVSRIAAAFAACREARRTALIPFVTGGYPDIATTEATVHGLVEGGADLVEIGVPFSDPLADGTTVQRTSQASLANGTRFVDCLDLVRRLRAGGVTVPILLMGYTNPMLQYGLARCAADGAEAGVDGFIVPDLPTEESDELLAACRAHGRDLVFLVAPTSTEARLRDVAARASGFVYCVSLTGVTGARTDLPPDLAAYVARVRAATDLPLALGFGISTADHVRQAGALVDGVVVASALINRLDELPPAEQPVAAAAFVRGLRGGA